MWLALAPKSLVTQQGEAIRGVGKGTLRFVGKKTSGMEQGKRKRKITGRLWESGREAMGSGTLGVCEGWLRCVGKGEGEEGRGRQQIKGIDMVGKEWGVVC